MCTGLCLDDIIVCPSCKRDDEGYKLGESDSPFTDLGNEEFRCICGKIFRLEKHPHEIHVKQEVPS